MRMEALEAVLTFLGSSLCHQLEERSYTIDGFQMPLCARCLGLHLGFLISSLLLLGLGSRRPIGFPSVRSLIILGLVMVPAVADVALSYLGVLGTDNTRRAVTGAMFGAALAPVLIPIISSLMSEQGAQREAALGPLHWSLLAVAACTASALALLSESSEPLFYAVAVAGIVGVFASMFSLVLMLVLLLSDHSRLTLSKRVALAAVATPLLLVSLALAHGALL